MSDSTAAPRYWSLSAWLTRYREHICGILVPSGFIAYVVLDGGTSRVVALAYAIVLMVAIFAWDEIPRHRWVQHLEMVDNDQRPVYKTAIHWEWPHRHTEAEQPERGYGWAYLRISYLLVVTAFWLAIVVVVALAVLAVVALLVIAVLAVASLVAVAFDFVYDFQVNLPTYVHFAVDNPVSAWCWQAFGTITGLIL